MKAYIIHDSPLGTDYWGEGMYALVTEKEEIIFRRWCSNRAFANHDLTQGIENMLREYEITDVWSNGVLVWTEGVISAWAESAFLAANEEYELINSDAR